MYTKTTIRSIILHGMIALKKTQMAWACATKEAMIAAGGRK
jgi:hypothetical protein